MPDRLISFNVGNTSSGGGGGYSAFAKRGSGFCSGAAAVLPAVVLAASFPASSTAARIAWTLLGLLAGAAALAALRRLPLAEGLAGSGVLSLTAALFFFHGHLHPAVLGHQPDHALAAAAAREDPSARVLPFVGAMPTNAAGFYARRDVRPFAPIELVKAVGEGAVKVAIVDVEALPTLASAGLATEQILELPAFPTSKPTGAFLLQRTRPGVVRHLALVRLRLSAAPRATR